MENKKGWFDDPGNVKLFLKIFFSSLVVLLIVDFFIHKTLVFLLGRRA